VNGTECISGLEVFESHRCTYVTCIDGFNGILFVCMHLEEAVDPLPLAGPDIENGVSCIEGTGIDPHEDQPSHIRIGSNFKGESSKRLVRLRFAHNLPVIARVPPIDGTHVNR